MAIALPSSSNRALALLVLLFDLVLAVALALARVRRVATPLVVADCPLRLVFAE